MTHQFTQSSSSKSESGELELEQSDRSTVNLQSSSKNYHPQKTNNNSLVISTKDQQEDDHHSTTTTTQSSPTLILSSPSPSSPSSYRPCCKSSSNTPQTLSAGLQADHVYRSQLPSWCYKIRTLLLHSLDREMPILEKIQRRCRSAPLDRVMMHSSWLGSHQFFILTLPLIFWFGDLRFARSQVYILALAVYLTGFLKDLFCVPRPYSPPIERLSISTHAREYGFPSSHSATSTSTVLVGVQYVLGLESPVYRIGLLLGLAVYGFLLVFGRVYCGMHSIQDVIFGCGIGGVSWSLYYCLGPWLEQWLENSESRGFWGLPIPILLILGGLLLTAAHPQPVEDCPCFEDSTAFVAVAVGIMTAHRIRSCFFPSSSFRLASSLAEEEGGGGRGVDLPQGIIKLILGLGILFGWRFLMKELLSRLLPPLFRLCAPVLELPRRHYAPTKDYDRYRDELREERRRTGLGASLIPSVVHLPQIPSTVRNRFSSSSSSQQASDDPTLALHPALRNRTANGFKADPLLMMAGQEKHLLDSSSPAFLASHPPPTRKSYDIDVLMRLIVYAGIGVLSAELLPKFFDWSGLNN